MQQAVILAVKMRIPRISIHSDSMIVVDALNGKITVPKDIINIVEDIRLTLSNIKDYRVEYCSRNLNREADALAKKALM